MKSNLVTTVRLKNEDFQITQFQNKFLVSSCIKISLDCEYLHIRNALSHWWSPHLEKIRYLQLRFFQLPREVAVGNGLRSRRTQFQENEYSFHQEVYRLHFLWVLLTGSKFLRFLCKSQANIECLRVKILKRPLSKFSPFSKKKKKRKASSDLTLSKRK